MTTTDPEQSSKPGSLMHREIAEQPAVFARLLHEHAGTIAALGRELAGRDVRFVLFAARGSSDHAALYGKYLVELLLGVPVGLVSPSTYTVYGARPDLSGVLFLAISQSGSSPDLVDSLTAARECGAITVAVTNDPSSALATAAERHLDIAAGPELSVAATKTYTAQLLALYLLVSAMSGSPARELSALPDAAAATLDQARRVEEAAGRHRYAERLVTTGRGLSYPSAREGALKLMETCYLSALAFSGADLLHGPLAMIDSGVPLIALVPSGPAGAAMDPVLAAVRERGADILEVGAGRELDVVTSSVPPELLPVLEILPVQLLAWTLALARGGDPDRPRGLNKVTRTW